MMPRKPQFFLPNVPVHIIIRGNSRKAIFAEVSDYQMYLALLNEGCEACECKIHAYVLMTNHVHLLVSVNYHQKRGQESYSLFILTLLYFFNAKTTHYLGKDEVLSNTINKVINEYDT